MSLGGGARGRGRGRGTGCALFTAEESDRRPKLLPNEDVPAGEGGSAKAPSVGTASNSPDVEVDPLDAFMAGIDSEMAKPKEPKVKSTFEQKAAWEELQSDDPVVSYCEAYEQGEVKTMEDKEDDGSDSSKEAEGEQADESTRKKRRIEPLPRVEHASIEYTPVQMNFYKPHQEIAKLTPEEVAKLRTDLSISAMGPNMPSPVISFAHLGLPKELIEGIRRHGYFKPTPIQAQAIPAGLSGRDVIGVAETGSGKTVAYLMPMLVHCAAQPALQKDEGPIGLVLCPTRELAIQIEKETFKFNKLLGLRSTTLVGGLSKKEQFKDIKKGSEIVIANPGRVIDIIKMKSGMNLRRCTFLVLDEADRMLHMGFEYQVRSIVQNVRPSRQTLLFSATLPPKIERLASDLLCNPVRIVVGELGRAAATITQVVEILKDDEAKWPWLSQRVEGILAKGQLLIFVKSIQAAKEICENFAQLLQRKAEALHGELEQGERMRILDSYRARKVDVLVATDLAARGLDVPSIHTVVSYDAPRDIETYTHRIGRTGRAGAAGEAFTLLVDEKQNRRMAAQLAENLKQAGATVSPALHTLASKYVPYRAAGMNAEKPSGQPRGSSQDGAKREDVRSRSRSRSGSEESCPATPP